MRPLNRPMFRYGGPIKEGIMTGMQDRPGYEPGGKVGQYFSNLGAKTLNLINPLKKAKFVQKGIPFVKSIPQRLKSLTGREVIDVDNPKIVKDSLGNVISRTTQTKFVPNYLGRDPGVKAIGAGYRALTGPTAQSLTGKTVQAVGSPTGLFTIGALTDALPGGDPLFGTRNIFGQKFDPETGIKTEGLFGRDLPAKKQLEEQRAKKAAQEEANKILAQQQLEANKNKKLEKQDPKVFEDRKKYYYKLMGLDKLKSDAVYDPPLA